MSYFPAGLQLYKMKRTVIVKTKVFKNQVCKKIGLRFYINLSYLKIFVRPQSSNKRYIILNQT